MASDFDTDKWEVVPSETGGGATAFDPQKWEVVKGSPSQFPSVPTPGSVAKRAGQAAVNFLLPPDPREHPVEFGLYTLQSAMPFLGDIPGLGMLAKEGVSGALTRLGATTGLGAGIAAATGQPVAPAARESAVVGTLGEAPAPLARLASGLGTAEKAATGVMRESAADTVSQKALENEFGVTASEAKGLAKPTQIGKPAQDLAEGKTALRQARQSAISEVGKKYEPIYGPLENQPVAVDDLASVGTGGQDAAGWLDKHGAAISPAGKKLLQQQALLGEPVGGISDPKQAQVLAKSRFDQLLKQEIATKGPTVPVDRYNELRTQAQQFVQPQSPPAPTIGQLRGHLAQLMQHANKPGITAMERSAAVQAAQPIYEALDRVIPDEQRPLLHQINNEYSQVNRIFPFKNLRKLQNAGTLPELGQLAFGKGSEAATSMAVSRMTEPQKELMRKAFGSWVLNESDSPTMTLSKLAANKDTVAALYPNSDFGKIDTWRKLMIGHKRMLQGPPGLPSQRQFEQGLQESIKKGGLTPEALQAATDALSKGNQKMPYILKYASTWGLIGALGGWGIFGHAPELIPVAAAYGAGHLGWRAIVNNPAALDMYRDFIMSGWTRKGGEAFGRLMVATTNDALRRTNQPEKQAIGYAPEMSEGIDALDKSRAEAIAPTPSASERAEKISKDLEKGKHPDIHRDLTRGRLSMDETNKLVQHASSTDANKLVASPIPLSEVVDALEQATPEELQMLLPLVQQRLQQELPQEKNMTKVANISKRFQAVQRKSSLGDFAPRKQQMPAQANA